MLNFFFLIILLFSSLHSKDFKGFGASLDILDRQTTKQYLFTIPIGQSINIGLDQFVVYQCLSFDNEEIYDEYALIHIFEQNEKDSEAKNIFLGWIIKSSPSLVVIEHPTYEIRLNQCIEEDPLYPEIQSLN